MKKNYFILKSVERYIFTFYNGFLLSINENYKKSLNIVKHFYLENNIENFNVFVYENNKLEKIEDFIDFVTN